MKVKKSNIVGCDDRIASFAFKKGLLTEHKLYLELTMAPSQTLANVFTKADATSFGTIIGSLRRTPPNRPTSHPRRQDIRMTYPTLGITEGSVSRALEAALHLVRATLNLRFLSIKSRPRLTRPALNSPLEPVKNSISHPTFGQCQTHFSKVLFFPNLNLKGLQLL